MKIHLTLCLAKILSLSLSHSIFACFCRRSAQLELLKCMMIFNFSTRIEMATFTSSRRSNHHFHSMVKLLLIVSQTIWQFYFNCFENCSDDSCLIFCMAYPVETANAFAIAYASFSCLVALIQAHQSIRERSTGRQSVSAADVRQECVWSLVSRGRFKRFTPITPPRDMAERLASFAAFVMEHCGDGWTFVWDQEFECWKK